ncbi:MAG: alpha/beta hydrolase [Verrucomicrobiales bacterium]|nr:alpha/beta hydrolase [Verrucomicrobiales bacterium]
MKQVVRRCANVDTAEMPQAKPKKTVWSRLWRIWAVFGLTAIVGFTAWCVVAYRASDEARQALHSDKEMEVIHGDGYWSFVSRTPSKSSLGLLFFPGSLVEPAAYAPLARAVALKGYPVLLIELPRRGAFGGASGNVAIRRARNLMEHSAHATNWVIAGHSLGGVIASRFVQQQTNGVAGLVLVGTSHPRDFSLAHLKFPVTKILGTRDGLASVKKSEETRHNLPSSAHWVVIEGGNHSQFGSYGFQPGDYRATITREQQEMQTLAAFLEMLASASHTVPIRPEQVQSNDPAFSLAFRQRSARLQFARNE